MDAVQNAVGRRSLAWILLVGLLALAACNLSRNPEAQVTPLPALVTATPAAPTPAAVVDLQATPQIVVSLTPTPVVVLSTALPTVSIPTVAGIVAASSTPTLVPTATVPVPQAVSLPTQAPASAPLPVDCPVTSLRFSRTYDNPLTISPVVASQDTCYQLQAGAVVTLSWPGVPANFREVTFYRRDTESNSTEIIGRDANAADGASIQWTVPAGLPSSLLYANVTNSADISDSIRVYVG